MTTAELIKKREEEKNKSQHAPAASPFKPIEGMNMAEARMGGNGVSQTETTATETPEDKTENPVSLYEAGKQGGNINKAENTLAGKSPITTPEYENFRNEVIGAQQFGIETEEQRKKRERADFIKQGLTGFTEGLSALANLYYTTKGAPSQKLTSQMPELQKRLYEERIERDKKLEKFRDYIRGKADKAEEKAYQDKVRKEEHERQDSIRKEQDAENKRRWDYTTRKQEEATAKADKRYEEEKAYNREKAERDYKERVRHNKAVETNAANRANGSKTGSGRLLRIQRPNGEPMVFRKDDLESGVNLSYIYSSLPDEYKVRDTSVLGEMVKGEDGKKHMVYPINNNPTKYEMQVAIGRALQAGAVEEIAEDIQVGAANPIHSSSQQSGSVIEWKPSSNNSNQANAVVDWKPSSNNSNQANAVVDWKPSNGGLPANAKEVEEILDKRKKRKDDMLQQGKDSLMKESRALKSDTFR